MDWKATLVTFGLVFLAELGDKTQLTTLLMAAKTGATAAVFIGAAAALCLSAGMGAVFGQALTRYVPPAYLQTGSGVAFVLLGMVLLFKGA